MWNADLDGFAWLGERTKTEKMHVSQSQTEMIKFGHVHVLPDPSSLPTKKPRVGFKSPWNPFGITASRKQTLTRPVLEIDRRLGGG